MGDTDLPLEPPLRLGAWAKLRGLVGIGDIGKIAKANRMTGKALQVAASDRANAIHLLSQAIELAKLVKGRQAERRRLLGAALLHRGFLQEQKVERQKAAESYLEARQYTDALPQPALFFLAGNLADRSAVTAESLDVYVDAVRAVEKQQKRELLKNVYQLLSRICAPDNAALAANLAFDLSRRLREVAPNLSWVHSYVGQHYLNKKQYEEAVGCFKKAQSLELNSREIRYGIAFASGMVKNVAGALAEAVNLFRQALLEDGDNPHALFMLGRSLVDLHRAKPGSAPQSDLAEASDVLERTTKAWPTYASGFWYWGRARVMRRETVLAESAFQKAAELDPKNAGYQFSLGSCLLSLGKWRPAREVAARLVELEPKAARGYRLLGQSQAGTGEHLTAAQSFEKAVALDENDLASRELWGISLFDAGKESKALGVLQVLPADHSCETTFYLGRCHLRAAAFETALKLLEKSAAVRPGTAQAHFYLGLAQAGLKEFSSAESSLTLAIELDPQNGSGYVQRGHARVCLKQLVNAKEDYLRAIELVPDDGEPRYHLARTLLGLGQNDEAEAQLRDLQCREPGNVKAWLAMGWLYESSNRPADALKQYSFALALDSDNVFALCRRGVVGCRTGGFAAAFEDLQKAAFLGHGGDEVLYYTGWSAAQLSRYDLALQSWSALMERYPSDQRLALNVSRLHYLYGKQYLAAGKVAEAVQEWTKFLESRSEDKELKRELAKLHGQVALRDLCASGPRKVQESLQAAVDLDPDDAAYRYLLAFSGTLEGNWKNFSDEVPGLIAGLRPELVQHARFHLALAMMASGDTKGAAGVFGDLGTLNNGSSLDTRLAGAVLAAYEGRWTDAVGLLGEPQVVAAGKGSL